MSFQPGDRVRLKLKPEIEMTLRHLAMRGRWEAYTDKGSDGHYDVFHRWPEEIELVPRPIQVGDLVRHGESDDATADWMEVLAIVQQRGIAWVIVDSSGKGCINPWVYELDEMVRKP